MKRRLTDDDRHRAVEQIESGEKSSSDVADALGVTGGTVARWRRRFAGQGSTPGREDSRSDSLSASPSEAVIGPEHPISDEDFEEPPPNSFTAVPFPRVDFDKLFPQVDTAALFPKIDYDKLFPQVDTAALFPKIDYDKLFPQPDFSKLRDWAEELRKRWWPPNWPAELPDFDVLNTILNDDGIPLVWVPRAAIVAQLLSAADRTDRIAILMQQRAAVIADCEAAASELRAPR